MTDLQKQMIPRVRSLRDRAQQIVNQCDETLLKMRNEQSAESLAKAVRVLLASGAVPIAESGAHVGIQALEDLAKFGGASDNLRIFGAE